MTYSRLSFGSSVSDVTTLLGPWKLGSTLPTGCPHQLQQARARSKYVGIVRRICAVRRPCAGVESGFTEKVTRANPQLLPRVLGTVHHSAGKCQFGAPMKPGLLRKGGAPMGWQAFPPSRSAHRGLDLGLTQTGLGWVCTGISQPADGRWRCSPQFFLFGFTRLTICCV